MGEYLTVLGAVLLTAGLIALGYIILVAPGRKMDIEKYKNMKFAHRGLHNDKRAENSMSAFAAACDAGFGIELDVRLSSDGELVVYHDDDLKRVARREGLVRDFTADELGTMKLLDTEDTIPRFSDVLSLVDGRVPLLVEIKEDAGDSAVSEATAKILADYKGDYLIESFNPISLSTVAKKLPGATRGILSHRYFAYDKYKKPLYFLLQALLLNRVCRPAFVAYDHNHYDSFSLKLARHLGAVTFAWTVRSEDEEITAREHGFDGVIFENYIPRKKK